MKRISGITAVAVASLLLVGCQSKRETCAQFEVYAEHATYGQLAEYWKRLGIEHPIPQGGDGTFSKNSATRQAIERFCEFYKS